MKNKQKETNILDKHWFFRPYEYIGTLGLIVRAEAMPSVTHFKIEEDIDKNDRSC